MAAEQIVDIRKKFVDLCYGADFEKKCAEYVASLPEMLKPLAQFLGDNRWLAGSHITWAGKKTEIATDICHALVLPDPTTDTMDGRTLGAIAILRNWVFVDFLRFRLLGSAGSTLVV